MAQEHGGGEPRMKRWTEQRWLIDNVIATVGIEFDQGRVSHPQSLIGAEAAADAALIRQRVKKFADIAPAFEAVARRREAKAKAHEAVNELITSGENYFMAAHWWASAQWPILENNETNLFYNQRKRECYLAWAKTADHKVEAAWIPFQGKKLPGWLHLPPGYKSGRLPTVVVISGMDGYKERDTPMYGDRWMRRGMAVLTVDGPGQYESAVLGIPVTVPGWLEAGPAIYDWLAGRPEIDAQRIGISGRSFGSFFSTLLAAGEPRFKACAVSGTCLEPGCNSIFEEAPPSFKHRFMYMAGYVDEEPFDEFRKTLTWEGHAQKIRAPYLCVTGEFDALSPLEHTERMMKVIPGPKLLITYQGSGHSVSGSPSTHLGPYFPTFMADWMAARLAGKPMTSERWFVEQSGTIAKSPL
jgi:dienelactone hydrolase